MSKVTIVSGIKSFNASNQATVWSATIYVGDKPSAHATSYDQGAAVADAVAQHRLTRTIRR